MAFVNRKYILFYLYYALHFTAYKSDAVRKKRGKSSMAPCSGWWKFPERRFPHPTKILIIAVS
jgi:hypothetical protein